MGVRKTEQRIPFYFSASDLGQANEADDSKSVLVSFLSTPIVIGRKQRYAIFVTDNILKNQVESYKWRIQNALQDQTIETSTGYWEITPEHQGNVRITVKLIDSNDQTLTTIELLQTAVPSNTELEDLINQDQTIAPLAAHPETSREVINDYRAYIDQIIARDLDQNGSLNRLIFGLTYIETLGIPVKQRSVTLEEIAEALNQDDIETFLSEAEKGIGLCQVKPHILGMYFSSTEGGSTMLLMKREFPIEENNRQTIIDELKEALGNLSENNIIDLFNILRFPKSNLMMCKFLVEKLREEYFIGEDYIDILEDRDKATSLIKQFKEGPTSMV